jgi:putative phosphoribosyl transferase
MSASPGLVDATPLAAAPDAGPAPPPAPTGGEHPIFANRCAAGRQLAARLASYRGQCPTVLALPRGGVPVAYEVAHALDAPLGVLVVRKIVAPGHPRLVIGAVAPGATYVDEETAALADIPREAIDAAVARERRVADQLLASLRGSASQPPVKDRTTIIVDDGIVTGATALVAAELIRAQGAAHVVVAAPVCMPAAYDKLRLRADEVVCITRPADSQVLACRYVDFMPVSEAEVRRLLTLARLERQAGLRYVGIA